MSAADDTKDEIHDIDDHVFDMPAGVMVIEDTTRLPANFETECLLVKMSLEKAFTAEGLLIIHDVLILAPAPFVLRFGLQRFRLPAGKHYLPHLCMYQSLWYKHDDNDTLSLHSRPEFWTVCVRREWEAPAYYNVVLSALKPDGWTAEQEEDMQRALRGHAGCNANALVPTFSDGMLQMMPLRLAVRSPGFNRGYDADEVDDVKVVRVQADVDSIRALVHDQPLFATGKVKNGELSLTAQSSDIPQMIQILHDTIKDGTCTFTVDSTYRYTRKVFTHASFVEGEEFRDKYEWIEQETNSFYKLVPCSI